MSMISGDGGKKRQERTFENQDKLPSLPVPDLRKTLDKYLDSGKSWMVGLGACMVLVQRHFCFSERASILSRI